MEGMKYCTNNGDLVFLIAVLSLAGMCAFAIMIVNFKQNRCKHDLLIKRKEADVYIGVKSEKACLTYYNCEHCEKVIKKITPATVKDGAESLKEEG